MSSLRKARSFLYGLTKAFVGRNNDVDGYWALGLLLRAALRKQALSDAAIVRDLADDPRIVLFGTPLPHVGTVIRRNHEKRSLEGLELTIALSFAPADDVHENLQMIHIATVDTRLSDGTRLITAQAQVNCWPHHPQHELRSTRVTT